ncbi:von Willebrand factor A domain-containing protein 8-like [Patiria miniata]|uniref:von Willebrand factor A domain-containing protein 8 n=1 Tax=Patiria miniata TaxID=46514 RepID=A0A913ZDS1_PATMI|nr:von Willebrand factor A domain-containing protein 8-like [Patiria miniata]
MLGLRIASMSAEKSLRRLRHLRGVLAGGSSLSGGRISPVLRACYSSDGKVSIGDVSRTLKAPANPELVPIKHLSDGLPQSVMRHLRWIMQKDALGQDVFLIGPPGPLRRAIAMQYLELTKREVEYLALTRDTTESDLKQRREIKDGTAFYIDQCAVRAATQGRILVIEGVEKAERNVLPVLNNLLENREMQLEDGRFLVAADRYDKLLKDHSQEELDAWKLVRVSEDFRVIALGLPVPRYRGNPLDPPLRSRFQARDINPLPFKDHLELLNALGSSLASDKVPQMLSFATALRSQELATLSLPDFPIDNLASIVKIMDSVPNMSAQKLLYHLYPYSVFLPKEARSVVLDALRRFELLEAKDGNLPNQRAVSVQPTNHNDAPMATVTVGSKGESFQVQVPAGTTEPRPHHEHQRFITTPSHEGVLADLLLSHSVQDFCIIGPKGCGKSVLTRKFADIMGYKMEPVMLYQDMTSRDLLQQRGTLPNGDTTWRLAPLITAALEGSIALLDGLHRVNPSTLAVLHRLVHDREISLFDGTRLLRNDRYQALKEQSGLTDEQMQERFIFPIHPSFRIVALAEPPVIGSSTQQWLNPELLTLFLYHHLRPLSMAEEMDVIQGMVPNTNLATLESLLKLTHLLRNSGDTTLQSLSSSLSTRNLLRIARRLSSYPEEGLHEAINKACLSRFLPALARQALDKALKDNGIEPQLAAEDVDIERALSCEVKNGKLRIGDTEMAVFNPDNMMMVPDTLFYDNVQHLNIMAAMLKDFILGEHLLLVGNQGVGKNKIVDRFLHLLNKPRQYIQLHRDTTVQSLTLQPNVQDGIIIYEDSPLVRAVKQGQVLIIDEADKAPTNVTCILKSLVESGEMVLADGRKIVAEGALASSTENTIFTHPDFRMIVLANRPGFPFLGNDFFGALGDIFSCHAVDNPSMESEMTMLRRYGPDVPETTLRKLVSAFSELREMADQGLITYPYSTREVVNMVKHLQKFPQEGLASVVNNVFDFDVYNKEMREQVIQALHKHGIPVGADPGNVQLAKEFPLPAAQLTSQWHFGSQGSSHRKMLCPVEERKLRVKGPVQLGVREFPLERVEARSLGFSELVASWQIPLSETTRVCDVVASKYSTVGPIHVLTSNPICLYSMKPHGKTIRFLDLYDIFPGLGPKPIAIAALGEQLAGHVLLHEQINNNILLINTSNGATSRLYLTSPLETAKDIIGRRLTSSSEVKGHRMCGDLADKHLVVFYQEEGDRLDVVDLLNGNAYSLQLPFHLDTMFMPSPDNWLLTEAKTQKKFLLSRLSPDSPVNQLSSIFETKPTSAATDSDSFGTSDDSSLVISSEGLTSSDLSAAVGQTIDSPNRVLADKSNYGAVAVGFPELTSTIDVYTVPRGPTPADEESHKGDTFLNAMKISRSKVETEAPASLLPEVSQVARIVPSQRAPEEVFPDGKVPPNVAGCIEVADLARHKVKYIPVPSPSLSVQGYMPWASTSSQKVAMATSGGSHVVTVDTSGMVRVWETGSYQLGKSLDEWYKLIGREDRHLQITTEKETTQDLQNITPKHGKVDPTSQPHVGGGTWAGGSGGVGTAGMGGAGGPYRLDGGHDVTQVTQVQKDMVPPEVLLAAREMAQKAFKDRLKEIQMSEFDAEMYERFSSGVRRQVTSLRVVLDSLQAKGKERQWMKHQTAGDLDEAKLIEGLTGERAIYKRRGEQDPELGSPQLKPKRLRLIVDVSGSMYRFNGYDGRLERVMESALMLMEAFEGYEKKFAYEIYGHSGDDYETPFVLSKKLPSNNKERLDVIKTMNAHAQFCMSGDNTLEATKHAIETITKDEGDEYFVIVLSDANFDRYGISPALFGRTLTADEEVNAYAIFIGSLGNQADVLVRNLPAGRGFVCLDTKNIPQILQQIFTSTLLSTR